MTQLTIISPLKIFSVFVNRNMKLYVIVLNVIMDVAVQETIDINNLLNTRKLEIYQQRGTPYKTLEQVSKKTVGERPLINCYLNDAKVKGLGILDLW